MSLDSPTKIRSYLTLGQDNPGASLTVLYTVPAATQAVAKLVVANREASANTFRMAVSPLGAAIANDHYWFYDYTLAANSSLQIDDVSLAATDVVRVYGEDTNVSFNLNGYEIA